MAVKLNVREEPLLSVFVNFTNVIQLPFSKPCSGAGATKMKIVAGRITKKGRDN